MPNENYFPEDFPENFKKDHFYKPSNQGLEKKIRERLNFLKELDIIDKKKSQ